MKSAPALEKRIDTLLNYATATGGLIPVPLTYYGAHTGRFSGSGGVNPQNLPSGIDGPAGKLRGLIVPAKGHRFVIVDADKIEARMLAWAAGQQDLVEVFADGGDVYSEFAATFFGEEVRKPRPDDPPELKAKLKVRRHLGKTAILGLGYGMGAQTFIRSVRNDPDLAVMLDDGTLTETFLAEIHRTYRSTYPAIPKFWAATEAAFRSAVSQGRGQALGIPFTKSGDAVYIELPSTRQLIYRRPSITSAGEAKETRKNVFGGLLVENIVQGVRPLDEDATGEQCIESVCFCPG